MIKTIALGLACLAGIGAIAVAAKKPASAPAHELVFPTVAGNKSDRLQVSSNRDTPGEVELAYTPPAETPPVAGPQASEAAKPQAPDFVPRHWHDPHDLKAKAAKPKASNANEARKGSPTGTSNKVADARDCRTDGLDPLLRKLNLAPPCNP